MYCANLFGFVGGNVDVHDDSQMDGNDHIHVQNVIMTEGGKIYCTCKQLSFQMRCTDDTFTIV